MWPFGFGIGNKYPYSDFHELNTDFLIQKCAEIAQNLKDSIAAKLGAETAQAAAEAAQEASETAQEAAETAQAGAETAETNTRDYYNNLVTNIGEDVTGWLNENVTPVGSAVTVDKSLTIEGSAADAKMTGNAIRGITGYNTINLSDWITGEYISDANGEVSREDASNWKRTDYIEIYPDQAKLKITSSNVSGAVRYNAYYDSNRAFISNFEFPRNTSRVLTPPDNAKFIRMSCTVTTNVDIEFDYYSLNKFSQVSRNANPISDLNTVVENGNYVLWASRSYTNAPAGFETGAKNLQVIVDRYDPRYIIQLLACTPNTDHDYISFMRVTSDGGQTWKNWFKVVDNRSPENNIFFDDSIDTVSAQGNNVGDHIRISTYNIARFNNDTETYISNLKLKNLRNAMDQIDADVLCTQEDDATVDGANKSSNDYLYYPKYPNRSGENGVAIHSKTAFISRGVLKFSNNQLLRYATIAVGSKTLLVLSIHGIWNYQNTGGESNESINSRNQQFYEMFNWISGNITLPNYADSNPISVPEHTHTVIGMDGNTTTQLDRTNLKNLADANNFILGNGGYLGWIYTCDINKATQWAIDNIIVSENIIINKFTAHSEYYDDLYSDHVPVSADITLL